MEDLSNLPLGALLEKLGFLSKEQIEIALNVQNISKKVLGEVLLDLDFVTSNEIAEAIAIKNKTKFVNLDQITPAFDALNLIPGHMAIAKQILPLRIENNKLIVATDNLHDLVTLDYIRKETRMNVEFQIADKYKISRYIQIYYNELKNPIDTQIKNIIKDFLDKKTIDVIVLINLILNGAIKDSATDIHLSPEGLATHIFYRIDGVLKHYYSIPIEIHQQIAARLKIISELDIAEQRKPQDGSFSYEFMDENFELRISTLPSNFGENVVLRLLGNNSSLFSLQKLGFTDENIEKIESYFAKPYGVILVTGPTGSGKTTTLYSALRKINALEKNILTVEDPIEYKFSFIKQTQINNKAGYTFTTALRSFMRQDPDVMLVGEIRDNETAELAVRASITGHLVLSTLHTNDAVGAINRLEDLKIAPYLMGSSLLAVIGQRLVRKLCEHCKEKKEISNLSISKYNIKEELLTKYKQDYVFEAKGCEHCRNTGYKGRLAIIEIFEINEEMEALISSGTPTITLLKEAKKHGMITLREDGYIKVLQGLTSFKEVDRVVL